MIRYLYNVKLTKNFSLLREREEKEILFLNAKESRTYNVSA